MRWGRRRARAIRASKWCEPQRGNALPRRSITAGAVSPAMCLGLLSLSKGQPATGEAFTATYERRTTANWIDFLCRVDRWIDPAVEPVYGVVDNLNIHSALDVLLFNLAHPRWEFVFQPKYAAYLNLIEPWWKILRSLALKGRRFDAWAEIEEAVKQATEYWNAHKHPFIWGRRRRHRKPRRPGVAALPNVVLI